MTLEQIKTIREIINRRDFIDEKIKEMQLVKNISLWIGTNIIVSFCNPYDEDFNTKLREDIINISKATIINTLKGYRAELTEQLKKLGVEE